MKKYTSNVLPPFRKMRYAHTALLFWCGLMTAMPCFGAVMRQTWNVPQARWDHTATLLPEGKVLYVGGADASNAACGSAQLFDLFYGNWQSTGSLANPRRGHTATLLPNGKVLVVGGYSGNQNTELGSAELFDPVSGTWSATGSLASPRHAHTATLLGSGKVLVTGGVNGGASLQSAELYDPATGTWTAAGNLQDARSGHTATLLPSGGVLVVGGTATGAAALSSAEIYNPATGLWSQAGNLSTGRANHTATLLPNGTVLVFGGAGGNDGSVLGSFEIFDCSSSQWSVGGSLPSGRANHAASLLPNGKVLFAGGEGSGGAILGDSMVYDPSNGTWRVASSLSYARSGATATILPTGQVMFLGGLGTGNVPVAAAEIYDPADGSWSQTGDLVDGRRAHSSILLPNGKVLVTGGESSNYLANAELYDPTTGGWTETGRMAYAREANTISLLQNGSVLVVGGWGGVLGYLSSAEIYDPVSGSWSPTGSLNIARRDHTATVLADGRILVVGGSNAFGSVLAGAEIYDPQTGTWTVTGSLSQARCNHSATLLPSGKVLVAGGLTDGVSTNTASAELYDPATGTWSATGNLGVARCKHTATLLPSGYVLVLGGEPFPRESEVYMPEFGLWTPRGLMSTGRSNHTATLLASGKVLVAGGWSGNQYLTTTEIFDPAGGPTTTQDLPSSRAYHTATLLPNGNVLVAGGYPSDSSVVFDPGLGASHPDWQPLVGSLSWDLLPGYSLALSGSRLQGVSNASCGNTRDSSANYPLVQVRSLATDQTVFLRPDPSLGWSGTSFSSLPLGNFPRGQALVTVFANGIQSNSQITLIGEPPSTFTYAQNPAVYHVNNLASNFPVGSVRATRYSIDPSLPAGLVFDSNTGAISGTPTQTYSASDYTVTAYNEFGSLSTTVNIAVEGVVPAAITGSALELTYQHATLSGQVNPNGLQTTCYFQFGPTLNYGSWTQGRVFPAGAADVLLSATASVYASTSFHYRLVAINSCGTSYGADQIFTTPSALPQAITGSASGLSFTAAQLSGTVLPNCQTTNVYFQYGTNTNYGQVSDTQQVSGTLYSAPCSAVINGLAGDVVFHYRMVAQNLNGTTYGSDQTYSRSSRSNADLASIAWSNGDLYPAFSPAVTAYQMRVLEYSPPTLSAASADPKALVQFRGDGADLTPSTKGRASFHLPSMWPNPIEVKVTAQDGTVQSYFLQTYFSQSPQTLWPTQLGFSAATLNGLVDASFPTVSFQYGPTTKYGTEVTPTLTGTTVLDGSSRPLSCNKAVVRVTGLAPATLYHYRLVAKSGAITQYGRDVTLLTSPICSGSLIAGGYLPNIGMLNSFGSPAINSGDQVAFRGILNGYGIKPENSSGIWVKKGGTTEMIVRTGSARAFSTGGSLRSGTFTKLGDPVLNNAAQVSFMGTCNSGTNGLIQGLWLTGTDGSLRLVSQVSGNVPDLSGTFTEAKIGGFEQHALTQQGDVVFFASLAHGKGGVTAANDHGLYVVNSNGQYKQIARKGYSIIFPPVLSGTIGSPLVGIGEGTLPLSVLSALQPQIGVSGQTRSLNSNGGLLFTASYGIAKYGYSQGIFAVTPNLIFDEVLSSGDEAPIGSGSANFASFESPIVNNSGHCAFRALISGSNMATKTRTGIWLVNNEAVSQVARLNVPASYKVNTGGHSVYTSGFFTAIGEPVLNNNDQVAFIGTFQSQAGNSKLTKQGIWVSGSNGELTLVAQAKDQAPGCVDAAEFKSFSQVVLPDQGGAIFVANLAGAKADRNQGIWAISKSGTLTLVARKGDTLLPPNSTLAKQVDSISIFTAPAFVGGQSRNFNPAGHVAYVAKFTDGTEGIYLVAIP